MVKYLSLDEFSFESRGIVESLMVVRSLLDLVCPREVILAQSKKKFDCCVFIAVERLNINGQQGRFQICSTSARTSSSIINMDDGRIFRIIFV